MPKKILVTGGAGFIGSFLVDELIKQGHYVVILDNLEPQIHGEKQNLPSYLNPKASFIKGDVRSEKDLARALNNIEIVFHYASAVGVGQSMYEVAKYIDINVRGTAQLWDYLINKKTKFRRLS